MSLCLSVWSFALDFQRRRMDIARFAEVCRTLGVEQVEMVDYFWISAGQPLSVLRDAGLQICAYDTATDFVQHDPESRHQQVQLACAVVEEAIRIGANVVRLLPGTHKHGVSDEDALQMVVESVSAVARYAHRAGAIVVLEPHEDVVVSAEMLRYVAEQVNSAAFGVNADLSTFLLHGLDAVRECAAIADLCQLVHLNDMRRVRKRSQCFRYRSVTRVNYEGTALGDGEIDIQRCLHALWTGGFRGPFSVEYLGMEDAVRGVQRSVANVGKILQEVETDG